MQIIDATSTEELRALLDGDDFDFRFQAGCTMPSAALTIEDNLTLANSLALHYVIYSKKAALDQLVSGLQSLGCLRLMRKHEDIIKPLFISSGRTQMKATEMINLFEVQWSEPMSNQRETEEAVILNWVEYVQEAEGTYVRGLEVLSINYTPTVKTLILVFV